MNMKYMFDKCMEKYQKLETEEDDRRDKQSTEKVTDADESFAQYVGLELKKHSETTKQVLKLEIQGLLLRATLGLLSVPNCGNSTNVPNLSSCGVGHTSAALEQPGINQYPPFDNLWASNGGSFRHVRPPFMFPPILSVASNQFLVPQTPMNGQSQVWSNTNSGAQEVRSHGSATPMPAVFDHGIALSGLNRQAITSDIATSMPGPRSCTMNTVAL